MDKYNKCYKKKKICPQCNGKVYNATLICKLLKNNNQICGYKFISRKKKVLSNVIFTFQKESKSKCDIQIINQLVKFKDIRCLSPYEERELEMISSENEIFAI